MHVAPNWEGISPQEVAKRGQQWDQDPARRPWFDQDDAEQKIDTWVAEDLISTDEAKLLSQWVVEGYFVLPGAIESSQDGLLDEYSQELDDLWTATEPVEGLQFMSVRVDGKKHEPLDHSELLTWPLEQRLAIRDSQSWRIHYYQAFSRPGLELASADKLMRLSNLLMGTDPELLNLTTYKYSSQSGCHQDMFFYHLHPANHFVGIWIACEDVLPDSGRLVIYPRSHRLDPWHGFGNYPQTNYRTYHPESHREQFAFVNNAVSDIAPLPMEVKRGDAIFTHGLTIHSAEEVQVRGDKSRFSMVLHYSVPSANKIDDVVGPFNY